MTLAVVDEELLHWLQPAIRRKKPVVGTQTLLEREAELDLLAGLLADIGSSGGKIVMVRGEAGIGKTALVREFINSAETTHVLTGACDDLFDRSCSRPVLGYVQRGA